MNEPKTISDLKIEAVDTGTHVLLIRSGDEVAAYHLPSPAMKHLAREVLEAMGMPGAKSG